eukprot:TRINITY_DN84789_c0_g1_i1.p1 TRINITY_DN84789_c0_g1~~TRINITY_DN84789_c0_g1_i1.p1  ORF type:complete len:107 (-),score=11.04 TRINITY_DN84789_c0_g1_i1:53-373(-)
MRWLTNLMSEATDLMFFPSIIVVPPGNQATAKACFDRNLEMNALRDCLHRRFEMKRGCWPQINSINRIHRIIKITRIRRIIKSNSINTINSLDSNNAKWVENNLQR